MEVEFNGICRRKTVLATLQPTMLLGMFDAPELAGVAQEVEDTIVKIIQEAASNS